MAQINVPRSLEELIAFLDGRGSTFSCFHAVEGAGEWPLIHCTSFLGTAEMMSLLLETGVGLYHYTDDDKTPLDIACDAGNWATFEVLARALDDVHQLFSPFFTYRSKLPAQLGDPFSEHVEHFNPY